jgi:hypothetical protein
LRANKISREVETVSFEAIAVRKNRGELTASLKRAPLNELPAEPVLVKVSQFALSYQDALTVFGNRNKITKSLPFYLRLAQLLPADQLCGMVYEPTLSEMPGFAKQMIAGKARGHTVITLVEQS